MSAGAAARAAAARAAAERNEEEEMTRYTPKDIAENWEFKILRSATGAFRDPDVLRTALDAEQRAGWTLVEKFDDARVRLKRSASARAGDASLNFDPYRTWVGMKLSVYAMLIVFVVAGVAAAAGFVAYIVAARPR